MSGGLSGNTCQTEVSLRARKSMNAKAESPKSPPGKLNMGARTPARRWAQGISFFGTGGDDILRKIFIDLAA